ILASPSGGSSLLASPSVHTPGQLLLQCLFGASSVLLARSTKVLIPAGCEPRSRSYLSGSHSCRGRSARSAGAGSAAPAVGPAVPASPSTLAASALAD